MAARSFTYIDGAEVRPGVSYLVAPLATLSFGVAAGGNALRVSFEEQGQVSPLMAMAMQGMAQNADVRKQLE